MEQEGFGFSVPYVAPKQAPRLTVNVVKPQGEIQHVMTAAVFAVDEVTDFITGWRAWHAGNETKTGGRTLRSLAKPTTWQQRDLVGECLVGQRSRRFRAENASIDCTTHLASFEEGRPRKCSCGIHTVKTPRPLPEYAQVQQLFAREIGYYRHEDSYIVIGACTIFGTVVETSVGFLSDRARIEALFIVPTKGRVSLPDFEAVPNGVMTPVMQEHARQYERQFGVPVTCRTQKELIAMVEGN